MKKILSKVAVLLVVLIVGIACGQTSPPAAPKATEPPAGPGGQVASGPANSWDKLVAEARKEGEVVYYTTAGAETRSALSEAFQQRFGIKLEFVTGRGPELSARVSKEYSGGIYIADVMNSGGGTFTALKAAGLLSPLEPALVLPEITDPKAWLTGPPPFIDRDKMFLGMLAVYEKYVVRNTDLVKDGEIVSVRDVLNPKWSGKIALFDPTATGSGASMVTFLAKTWGKDQARDFLTQLAKQKPALSRDKRLHAEWTAKGKYPISLAPNPEMMAEFIDMKLPVAHVKISEGGMINTVGGAIGLLSKPQHPNAARVFINWMLSKEGHGLYVSSVKLPGARVNAPTEGIDPNMIARPGDKFTAANEQFFFLQREMLPISREIFGAMLK